MVVSGFWTSPYFCQISRNQTLQSLTWRSLSNDRKAFLFIILVPELRNRRRGPDHIFVRYWIFDTNLGFWPSNYAGYLDLCSWRCVQNIHILEICSCLVATSIFEASCSTTNSLFFLILSFGWLSCPSLLWPAVQTGCSFHWSYSYSCLVNTFSFFSS